MVKKSGIISLIIAIFFGVLAVVTLPGFFSYFYRTGTGHAISEIMDSEQLWNQWDKMGDAERAPYKARARAEGVKCALFMTFGQHLPFFLFILISIGLLTSSIPRGFRVFLRCAFFGVWIIGLFFLAIGTGYWGQASSFPYSLGPAFLIYLAVVTFFGVILGIGKLIRPAIRKPADIQGK
jgi:hypothetical protein